MPNLARRRSRPSIPSSSCGSRGFMRDRACRARICHMPYKRVGAHKVSDHHVRSPLLNVQRACQTCHQWPEAELQSRVTTIQERTYRMRNLAMDALTELIGDIKATRASGVATNDARVVGAMDFQRKAQFYVDFIEAENSMGFHAPQEAVRILGESIDFSRKGQNALRSTSARSGAVAAAPQSSR